MLVVNLSVLGVHRIQGSGIRMYPWIIDPSCTQIGPVLLFALLSHPSWPLVLTYWLDHFGYKLANSFRVNPLSADPSYTQIRPVFLFGLLMISQSRRLWCWPKCWLVDLSDLGITWVIASGLIPEQLTQVAPKSDQSFSLLCWWYLRHGVHGANPEC